MWRIRNLIAANIGSKNGMIDAQRRWLFWAFQIVTLIVEHVGVARGPFYCGIDCFRCGGVYAMATKMGSVFRAGCHVKFMTLCDWARN